MSNRQLNGTDQTTKTTALSRKSPQYDSYFGIERLELRDDTPCFSLPCDVCGSLRPLLRPLKEYASTFDWRGILFFLRSEFAFRAHVLPKIRSFFCFARKKVTPQNLMKWASKKQYISQEWNCLFKSLDLLSCERMKADLARDRNAYKQ